MQTDFFEQLRGMEVLVVGDIMLDRYLRGEVKRISPEAPVPILDLQAADNRLGGAGNVALNLLSLGATPLLCSVIGQDEEGEKIWNLLEQQGLSTLGLFSSNKRRTTVKIRLLAGSQHLLRVDKEDRFELSPEEEKTALDKIRQLLQERPIRVVLFQDYDKGFLSTSLIEQILDWAKANDVPTVADPKFRHFYDFKGVNLFKPNLKEVRDRLPFEVEPQAASLQRAAAYLRKRMGFEHILITLSEHGAFIDGAGKSLLAPTRARDIVDVCGAGDAVISIVALAIALGLPAEELVRLANAAGGQVCQKPGVVAVKPGELQKECCD